MATYEIIAEDIASAEDIDGYASVLCVQAVINKSVKDRTRYAELFIHECLECINNAKLEYCIKHEHLNVLGKELSKILLATGWTPPEIPPEGFKI